jgi:hypothetical protein
MKSDFDEIFSKGSLSSKPPCYETHPTLKLGAGILCGGSASWPIHKDADVYVALQAGSSSGRQRDPWETKGPVEIFYAISDMQAPPNVARFKKMIDYLCNQLQEGKKVHVGCIGGHGRTGIILSAIVAQLNGEKDAISWVRKKYCHKAVESKAQVEFLHEHYGITKVPGTKSHHVSSSWLPKLSKDEDLIPTKKKSYALLPPKNEEQAPRLVSGSKVIRTIIPEGVTADTREYKPLGSARCLWKSRKNTVQ